MKKVYLLSTLLCAAMALPAQQVWHNDVQVAKGQVKATRLKAQTYYDMSAPKDLVPNFANKVEHVNAPADDFEFVVFTSPVGVYSQMMQDADNEGMFSYLPFDIWYLPALTDTRWLAWSNVPAGENAEFEFSFIDQTGETDDEPLEYREGSGGILNLFGSYIGRSVRIKGMYNGATAEWDRSMVLAEPRPEWVSMGIDASYVAFMTPIATAVENGTIVESTPISAAAIGESWGYYGYFKDNTYFGDGGMPDVDVTGLVQVFTAPASPLYIFGGTIACSAGDDKKELNTDGITVELWTVEDGQLSEQLAVSTDNKLYGTPEGKGICSFKYVFQDTSGMFPVPAPVVIPAGVEFAIVINNIKGTNFAISFSVDHTGSEVWCGGGYMLEGDREISLYNPEAPGSPYDFAIGMDVYMPVAKFAQATYLSAPVEGGQVSAYNGELEQGTVIVEGGAVIASTHPYVDANGTQQMTITAPEWVTTLEADTTGYAQTGNFSLYMEADKLPDGMQNRHGEVKISMYGYETAIRIGQGTGWSGVETTVAEAEVSANVVAGDFVLTYGEGVDKVDVYNVAGSLVASYALPANGYFTVPASDWAKGLYVLNFTGEKKATVKVVK